MRGSSGCLLSGSTSSSGARTGSVRNMTALITVKIAALAPMPSARIPITVTVKPGDRDSSRAP